MRKSLTRRNKELRERIKDLEDELKTVKDDRAKFRDFWIGKLRWFIKLHGEGKTPSMAWLIEDMSKLFARVDDWYWGY